MTIEGVGEVLPWGDWWKLLYRCGHETMFPRGKMNYAADAVRNEVLAFYAECRAWEHRHTPPTRPLSGQPG